MTGDAADAAPLSVLIAAADPLRRRGLEAIVTGAGHRVVARPDEAEVALVDGAADETEGLPLPVIALGAAEAGQAGLLPGNATPTQIDAALRAAAAGLVVRAAAFRGPHATASRGVGPRPVFRALADTAPPLLSPREAEILALIGDGLSNKAVARRLGISGHTVKFHIESLFRKLAATSRAEAVRKGLRQGLIEL